MKSTDLRAKARAIFGSAIAEPMPNQPNGAKALQQRANARPIPTYKVGGVVKKADGGGMKPKLSTAERKMGDALMMTRKGKEIMNAQKRMEDEKEMQRRKKQEAADRLLGIRMKKGGSVEKKADGGLLDRVGRAISDIANEGKTKKYGIPVGGVPRGSAGRPARNATDGAGSGSNAPVTVTRREESVTVNPNPPKEKPKYVKLNEKPKYVKLNEKPKYVKLNAHKDGGSVMKKAAGGSTSPFGKAFADARKRGEKTFNFGGKSYTTETREDVQKRAMAASAEREKRTEGNRAAMRQKTAAGTEERGKSSFQRSTDKFYKKYPEAMKKGGKAKDGLAVMIAIGKPMKGMKKPVKRAVGGAGKTRKGMCK